MTAFSLPSWYRYQKALTNWKDATFGFRQHESSKCHREAVVKLVTLPAVTQDIGEMLSSAVSQDRAENWKCLLKILCALQILAQQGCAFRGHNDESGNFYQLFSLLSREDQKVTLKIETHHAFINLLV